MASDHGYHPHDTIGETVNTTFIVGTAGLTVSSIQNTLQRQNYGVFGPLTKFGRTFATYAAMGASYQFVKSATANLRKKDDSWNAALGGFVGGAMIGISKRTLPAVIGFGAGLGIILGVFDYTGGSLFGYPKHPEIDEYARKEFLRGYKRRPIDQTVEELGEGRGIYAPGYEERRRQRIKENYGIDVNPPPAS